MASAELDHKQHVLDAGCGVCGPAIRFAAELNIEIKAITISEVQAQQAIENVEKAGLQDRIKVAAGDFHDLRAYYADKSFDRAYFLESLGHSSQPDQVIEGLSHVMRPGSKIYIKEVFRKVSHDPVKQKQIDDFLNRMDEFYAYHTLSLEKLIHSLRSHDFEIDYIRKIGYHNDISFRDTFEQKFGIDLFEDDGKISPGEWLEIRCTRK